MSQLVEWSTDGDVSRVPEMRTQLVSARSVAERLADLATDPRPRRHDLGDRRPREESLVEMAKLLVAQRGNGLRIEGTVNTDDPDHELNLNGALLPGPGATLAGPTFEEWLDTTS